MGSSDIVIIGAGGHGRVVLDILRAQGKYVPIGFLDANPALAESLIDGVPVLGAINLLPNLKSRLAGGIVAIGDNRAREQYACSLAQRAIPLLSAVHPSATLAASASVGGNVVVCAGAVVGPEAQLADSVIVNSNAVVEHECQVEQAAHIAPGALLAGRVRVGRRALVGLGAKVIQCLSIGDDATIGAGAVVLRDVAAGATVVGVPAREIGQPGDGRSHA